jgi:hypothetical protein
MAIENLGEGERVGRESGFFLAQIIIYSSCSRRSDLWKFVEIDDDDVWQFDFSTFSAHNGTANCLKGLGQNRKID